MFCFRMLLLYWHHANSHQRGEDVAGDTLEHQLKSLCAPKNRAACDLKCIRTAQLGKACSPKLRALGAAALRSNYDEAALDLELGLVVSAPRC